MTEANQRLLNEAAEHINQQGTKSGSDSECYYSSESHGYRETVLHCALWPAIDVYDDEMEEGSFGDLLNFEHGVKDWALNVTPGLADAIQSAHDNATDQSDAAFLQDFNYSIRSTAGRFGLEVPAVSA